MKTKLNYPTHTMVSAPENSKPALEQLQKAFGVVPNIAGAIANSPKLVNSLVGVFQQVHSSSLTEPEIQIVLLTDAVVNACTYAVAFHTGLALQQGVSPEATDAIREHRTPGDKRFAALSSWPGRSSKNAVMRAVRNSIRLLPPALRRNRSLRWLPLWRLQLLQTMLERSPTRRWKMLSGSTPGKFNGEG